MTSVSKSLKSTFFDCKETGYTWSSWNVRCFSLKVFLRVTASWLCSQFKGHQQNHVCMFSWKKKTKQKCRLITKLSCTLFKEKENLLQYAFSCLIDGILVAIVNTRKYSKWSTVCNSEPCYFLLSRFCRHKCPCSITKFHVLWVIKSDHK